MLRGIDRVRDGYAAIVRRLVRGSRRSALVAAGRRRRRRVSVRRADADRLPAGGGPGRLLHRGAAAGGRLGRSRTRAVVRAGRGDPAGDAARGKTSRRSSASAARRRSHSPKPPSWSRRSSRSRTGPRRRAVGPGRSSGASRRRRSDPHRQGLRLQPAADHRPGHQRRLRVPARGPARAAPAAAGSAMHGLVVAANQDPGLRRVFSHLRGRQPVALSSTSTARRRRRSGVAISDIFTALQATLGGSTSTTSTCSAAPGR